MVCVKDLHNISKGYVSNIFFCYVKEKAMGVSLRSALCMCARYMCNRSLRGLTIVSVIFMWCIKYMCCLFPSWYMCIRATWICGLRSSWNMCLRSTWSSGFKHFITFVSKIIMRFMS